MAVKNENTNLASEFYVMSLLHRLGLEPILTVANKKSIDIFIQKEDSTYYSIDVKSVAKKLIGY